MIKEEELYRTYSHFLQQLYGCRVYKLPVNLPVTCPNRINSSGCSFCAESGTGFEAMNSAIPVIEQLSQTRDKIKKRYKAEKFIAYFQNYTNTFLAPEAFRSYMEEAAQCEDIVELAVSTRPDCIRKDYLDILAELREHYKVQICVELGLQSVNYHTLDKIERGHGLAEWLQAVLMIKQYDFLQCTHVILNLPWDTMRDTIETAKVLSAMPIDIVKAHSLYIPYNTRLYSDYKDGKISLCSQAEYVDRLVAFVEHLRDDIVIERLFSRVPEKDAAFSNWGTSWWKLRDIFMEQMRMRESFQGVKCTYLNGAALRKGGY